MNVRRACVACSATYHGSLTCPTCGAPGEPIARGLGRGKGRLTDSPDGRPKVAICVRIPPDVADLLAAACTGRGDRSRIVVEALRAHFSSHGGTQK
jgi:hypothetical protein